MAPPTHTFPCPFCGRRMGVRAEMLGRKVRCPHCSQIVLAPGPAGTVSTEATPPADISQNSTESKSASAEPAKRFSYSGPTPQAAPTPLPPAVQPQPVGSPTLGAEEPNYSFERQREAADSILSSSDESDDEVFTSQTQNKVPLLPKVEPDTAPPQSNETGTAPLGTSASKIPTLELLRPVEIVPAPISASALLPQSPVESPPNPFAFEPPLPQPPLAASVTPPTRDAIPVPASLQPQANAESLPPDQFRNASSADGSKSRYLVYGLAIYAAIATILAIYGLFFHSSPKLDPGHPLSTIPDSFGEFDPASRKKVSQIKIDFDAPLPAGQKAGIGQTIEVGQLQIEPAARREAAASHRQGREGARRYPASSAHPISPRWSCTCGSRTSRPIRRFSRSTPPSPARTAWVIGRPCAW